MLLSGENRNTGRKTCPSATLSNTDPTWTGRVSNPDRIDERSATNRLRKNMRNRKNSFLCIAVRYPKDRSIEVRMNTFEFAVLASQKTLRLHYKGMLVNFFLHHRSTAHEKPWLPVGVFSARSCLHLFFATLYLQFPCVSINYIGPS